MRPTRLTAGAWMVLTTIALTAIALTVAPAKAQV